MADVTTAERVTWQRRSAAVLAKLLELAAKQGLPPITWTVQSAGASLVGSVLTHPGEFRRGHFVAWAAAIATATGISPDRSSQHRFTSGETVLTAGWENVPVTMARVARTQPAVDVALVASIWDEEGEASE